jgi:multidrug efflux pump subunit AcrB
MKLVEFSVKNPMVGHLLTIILLLGGIVSMVSLKREVFPETNLNLVVIRTAIPDTSPEEVELQITDLIEEELADLEGIDTYTSQSQEGMSYVVVQLDSDYGQKERLISDIQRRVDQIELIDSAKKPVIRSITTAQPVLKICITSMEDDERALRRYADGLKDRIEGLPDVGTVERTGWRDEEFWVEVNLEKLNALDLSIDAIVAALSLRNVNFPGGKLPEGNKEVILRTVGKFHQPEEMEAIIVRSNIDGEIVQLKEVATVKRTYEPDALYSEFEGKRTIILGVKKKNSGDVIDLADRLKALVVAEQEKAEGTFGLAIIDDQSFYVKRRLNVVTNNGLVGIALVLAVLLVFLNWRVAFFTAFGIPFSLLVSFILMIYFGLTINLKTLFGLILVLGMIVDDAIIVGENVYRHIEEGMAPPQAAIVGTQEVSWPVLTTVATTIAAFLPMYFAPDLYADYLGWLVITVIVTLAASLFECLYLMPAHIAEFGKSAEDPRQRNPVRRAGDALINAAGNLYTRGIRVCLRHYIIVLLLVFGAFGGVVWAIKDRVKIDPFPADLIDIVMVSVTTPTGSSLEYTEKILAKFEAEVAALPDRELGNYISYIGRQVGLEGTVRNSGTQYGQVVIYLTPQEERNDRKTATILRELEARWSKIAGVEKFQTEEAKPGPPAGGDIEVKIV